MKCRYRTKTPIRCALTQCARPRALNGRVARGTFFDGELIVMRWEGESPPPTAPTRPGWSIIPSNPCLPTLSRELGVKGDQMVTEFKTALTARRREREKKSYRDDAMRSRASRRFFFLLLSPLLVDSQFSSEVFLFDCLSPYTRSPRRTPPASKCFKKYKPFQWIPWLVGR